MTVHASFVDWFKEEVANLPANQLRLDGLEAGGSLEVVARFHHGGRQWQVHGDTRVRPLQLAYEEAMNGLDPFRLSHTRMGRPALRLSADVQRRYGSRNIHVYIYG